MNTPNPSKWVCHIKHSPTKRFFDLIFSISALILLSPLYLAIFLLVRLTSPGKALFSHERIGRAGKPFACYKFRTMYKDANIRLKELLESDPEIRKEWYENFKLKNDPRITPIGHFLRKTSLDELPQFWNVLIGDLSVVGPRPTVAEEIVKHYGVKASKILSVRPGLTGLWQVSGRNDTSYSARVKLDEKYIDTRNLMMDIKLIAKTVPCMVNSKGAY